MVHGSPKPESNADMFRVVERVRATHRYIQVKVGFMECNAPDIPTAIDTLVSNGARSIVAVPYFLHAGTHVADDLPTLLEAAQKKYSGLEFLLGDYLGREAVVTDVLRARLAQARPLE
jgi:sirohydrochlorin cobaltochelatase